MSSSNPTCLTLYPAFALVSINITFNSFAFLSPSSVVTCLVKKKKALQSNVYNRNYLYLRNEKNKNKTFSMCLSSDKKHEWKLGRIKKCIILLLKIISLSLAFIE